MYALDLVTIIVIALFIVVVEIYLIWQYFFKQYHFIKLDDPDFILEVLKWEPDSVQRKLISDYSMTRQRWAKFKRIHRKRNDEALGGAQRAAAMLND